MYDVLCTLPYGIDELAMYIDDVRGVDRVTAPRLVNEVVSWGVSRSEADALVGDLLERSGDVIARARDETPGLPDEILETVEKQRRQLMASWLGAGRPLRDGSLCSWCHEPRTPRD